MMSRAAPLDRTRATVIQAEINHGVKNELGGNG